MENIDISISALANQVTARRGGRFQEFTPAWAESEAGVTTEGTYSAKLVSLVVIAGLIGAIGILTNSQILIVGAMVAGPEYGAILSLAFGVTRRDASRVARSAAALAIGSTLAALAALLLSLVVRWAGLAPAAYTLGSPVSNLIDAPNSFFLPRRCPGWRGRCHLTHRGPVEHDYRGGHLGHHHPDSVGHRCVCRVRQLDRGLGLRCPAGAQRFGPYRRCDPWGFRLSRLSGSERSAAAPQRLAIRAQWVGSAEFSLLVGTSSPTDDASRCQIRDAIDVTDQ